MFKILIYKSFVLVTKNRFYLKLHLCNDKIPKNSELYQYKTKRKLSRKGISSILMKDYD